MSNWEILTPAVVDTSTRTAQRWSNTVPGNAYSKIPMQIVIPTFSLNLHALLGNTGFNNITTDWQFGMFNYTAPEYFTLPNIPFDFINQELFYYVVRYRVGNFCTRYSLPSIYQPTAPYIPPYNGQIIAPQFSIEIWAAGGPFAGSNRNGKQIVMNTSIMVIPPINTFGIGPSQLVPSGPVSSDLFIPIPTNLPLPYNWPSDALWNSN